MPYSPREKEIWIHVDKEVAIYNRGAVHYLPLKYKWAKTLVFSLISPNRNRSYVARAVVDPREDDFLDSFRTTFLQPVQRQLRKAPWSVLGELLTDRSTNELHLAHASSNIGTVWQLAEQGRYYSIPQYLGQLPEKLSFFHGFKEVRQRFLGVAAKAMHAITIPLIRNGEYCEQTANQLDRFTQIYPNHAPVTELYLKLLIIHQDFERCEEVCQRYYETMRLLYKQPDNNIVALYQSLEGLRRQETQRFLDKFGH